MVKTRTYEKRALLTGVGNLFLEMMETEETPSNAPVYSETVYETPSLDTVNAAQQITEKDIYLSNEVHDSLVNVQRVDITVDAGYLPVGFAEEAQGMVKIGGGWSMPRNPKKKPFRMAVPITDMNGDEIIFNYPKCTLSPVNTNAQTQGEEINEQLKQFNIRAVAPLFKGEADKSLVYHQIDLADTENKAMYDRDKLLTLGWYDEPTLALCEIEIPGG